MQELPNIWRATAPYAVNSSGDFLPREFAAALHHLKPGKTPGPDSICPELLIHAEALTTWLSFFLLALTQNFKSLEKGAGSRDS